MLKKNVLLASAALVSLGMTGSVSADEKGSVETASSVTVPAKTEAKMAVAPKVAASDDVELDEEELDDIDFEDEEIDESDVEEDFEDEEIDESDVEEDFEDEEIDDSDIEEDVDVPETKFSKEYDAQIIEWMNAFSGLVDGMDHWTLDGRFDVKAFLDAFYYDVFDLRDEVEAFTAEHGTSDMAAMLLDGLNLYLSEVQPQMDLLQELLIQFEEGALTEAEFNDALAELLGFVTEIEEKTVMPVEQKTVTPEVKASLKETSVETLPSTGSDAQSFLSILGAALAGLTVWGFGFKKRG